MERHEQVLQCSHGYESVEMSNPKGNLSQHRKGFNAATDMSPWKFEKPETIKIFTAALQCSHGYESVEITEDPAVIRAAL